MSSDLFAQARLLSGIVCDTITGEFLTGAVVFDENSEKATTTNQYGFFTLPVSADVSMIRVSYVGYLPKTLNFSHFGDTLVKLQLLSSNELDEIVVFGNRPLQKVSGVSEISVPISLSKTLPSFIGEPDVFKTIQRFPGVQSGVEGSSGLHVRGGSPDQNLILINEIPVYNVGHLLGFFSVFNSDALRNVKFVKGGLPARYSGRLSSVVDVKMKEGNLKEYFTSGAIGLLSAQITSEGPIIKDKLGFMIGARRTYYDLFFSPILAMRTDASAGYHFYDLNASLNYKVNERSHIYYSFYNGQDKAKVSPDVESEFSDENRLSWGNGVHSLRWNYMYKNGVFSNLSLGYSKYSYSNERVVTNTDSAFVFSSNGYDASIRDLILKYSLEHKNLGKHKLRYGLMLANHYYKPGETFFYSYENRVDTSVVARHVWAWEANAYFEDEISIRENLMVNVGFNASAFFVDDTSYKNIEPRLSFLCNVGERSAIKGSYARTCQYVGLLSSANVGLPNDLWIPVTKNIPPLKSDQYSLGYHFNSHWFNFSGEAFYKDMQSLVGFKQGASFMLGREYWDEFIAKGTGEAYGIEFLLEKNLGRVNGWLSYTISKNQRHFPEIDDSFPYKYDRRHNLSMSAVFNISKRSSVSANWVYYSGAYMTLPELRYVSFPALENGYATDATPYPGSSTIEASNERNNYQLDPYHRLDLAFSVKQKRYGVDACWNFGVYNVYCQNNNFFTLLLENNDYEMVLYQYSIIPFMPYVRYEFNF